MAWASISIGLTGRLSSLTPSLTRPAPVTLVLGASTAATSGALGTRGLFMSSRAVGLGALATGAGLALATGSSMKPATLRTKSRANLSSATVGDRWYMIL